MTVILTVLAIARVTRLITTDMIFEGPRNWVLTRIIPVGKEESEWRSKLGYLILCPWCMSIYVGAVAACAYAVWGETMPYMVVTLALAASYATGFLAARESEG